VDPPVSTTNSTIITTENLRRTVDHIVVVMARGRSFDHLLGSLSLERGRSDVDGLRPGHANQDRAGRWHGVRPVDPDDPIVGLRTDPLSVAAQTSGAATGYVRTFERSHPNHDPGLVMAYHDAATAPTHVFLAEEFAVCDAWFSSVAGSGDANRIAAITVGAPQGRTIFHELGDRDESWRWYGPLPSWTTLPSTRGPTSHPVVCGIDSLAVDAASGDLPSFAWIEPPPEQIDRSGDARPDGEELLATVYNCLRAGPAWTRTLLIAVHDNHGGYFDHVVPPAGRGPRVAALLVSPWLPARSVCHAPFDHRVIASVTVARFAGRRGPARGQRARLDRGEGEGEAAAVRGHDAVAAIDRLLQLPEQRSTPGLIPVPRLDFRLDSEVDRHGGPSSSPDDISVPGNDGRHRDQDAAESSRSCASRANVTRLETPNFE
jgi:phospholipase C